MTGVQTCALPISPFALIVAAAFFICSTISANAIAHTLKRLDDEILLE